MIPLMTEHVRDSDMILANGVSMLNWIEIDIPNNENVSTTPSVSARLDLRMQNAHVSTRVMTQPCWQYRPMK